MSQRSGVDASIHGEYRFVTSGYYDGPEPWIEARIVCWCGWDAKAAGNPSVARRESQKALADHISQAAGA